MPFTDRASEPDSPAVHPSEYSGVVSSRHDVRAHPAGRRLRLIYFCIASTWGFLVGAGGILAALQSDGRVASVPGADALVYVIPGLAFALGGGAIVAGAYQDAKRRK